MAKPGILAVTAACAVLAGCGLWSAPKGEPATPAPITATPSPFDPSVLAASAQRCGTSDAVPMGDASFVAEVTRPTVALPSRMNVPVGVTVPLTVSHGKHSTDLDQTKGYVTDPTGMIVGLVTGVESPTGGPSAGASISAQIVVRVGACPSEDREVGDPLGDGSYQLVLSGPISAVDHNHAQAEAWVAPALDLDVADGEIVGP